MGVKPGRGPTRQATYSPPSRPSPAKGEGEESLYKNLCPSASHTDGWLWSTGVCTEAVREGVSDKANEARASRRLVRPA